VTHIVTTHGAEERRHSTLHYPTHILPQPEIYCLFFVKGPAADATDAPQPWGLLYNPVIKMVSFFFVFCVMEHRWNEIYRGKSSYSEKAVPVPLCPTWTDPGSKPGLRGERPATNRLSHGTADLLSYTQRLFQCFCLYTEIKSSLSL
jgi:hypothetical protein